MFRNELLVMMSSSEKDRLMTLTCITVQHTFMLGLCSKWSLGGSLPSPEMWNYASLVETVWLKKLPCSKISAHMCATNFDLSCLSHAVSFWTTYNVYGFRCRLFQRILWTVVCSICNSALAWEIDFFKLRAKACLTSTSSSDLGSAVEYLFFTLPVSLNCFCHLLVLLSSGGLTPYSHLNWQTRIMNSNFTYHNMICTF
jgi:hypothetical protein